MSRQKGEKMLSQSAQLLYENLKARMEEHVKLGYKTPILVTISDEIRELEEHDILRLKDTYDLEPKVPFLRRGSLLFRSTYISKKTLFALQGFHMQFGEDKFLLFPSDLSIK